MAGLAAFVPPGQARMAKNYPPIQKPTIVAHPIDAKGRKTYTYAEYHAHTGGDQAGYQKYLTYVHNVRAAIDSKAGPAAAPAGHPAAAPVEDPNDPSTWGVFAPVSQALGQKQATAAGMAAFQPQIANENASYASEQQRQADIIQHYQQGLASFLQGIPTGADDFAKTQAVLAAGNSALQQQQQGVAGEAQSGLANFLSSIGAPEGASKYASDIGARGASVAGNIAAAGQTQLEGGAQRQGALSQYLQSLPAISAIGGRRQLGDTLATLSASHAKTVGDLRSQMAEAIQKEYDAYTDRELQKGTARATYARYGAANTAKQTAAETTAAAKVKAAQIAASAKQAAAISKVATHYGTDGSIWQQVGKNPPVQVAPAGTIKQPAKTNAAKKQQQSEINAATKKASSLALSLSKTKNKVTYQPHVIAGEVVGKPDKITTPVRVSSYHDAIAKVKAAIKPLLPGWTDEALTRFAQQQVNPYYPADALKG